MEDTDLRELLAATGRMPPPFWIAPEDNEDLEDGVEYAYPELITATQEDDDAHFSDDEAVAKMVTGMWATKFCRPLKLLLLVD